MEIVIELPGPLVAWSAPRVLRGKAAFSPHYRYKRNIQWSIRDQYQGKMIVGPVELMFTFEMQIPESWSKRKKQEKARQFAPVRPDTTNLQKMYEDCLVGIVIKDDNQSCKILSEKIYSICPKVTIKVIEL